MRLSEEMEMRGREWPMYGLDVSNVIVSGKALSDWIERSKILEAIHDEVVRIHYEARVAGDIRTEDLMRTILGLT